MRHPSPAHTVAACGLAVALLIGGGAAPVAAFTGRPAPEIGGTAWFNSPPLSIRELRERVVLVEFWTFGCFNCRNIEPQVKRWHQRYADRGLVVVAVHAPEFAYERDAAAVEAYVRRQGIGYAVVLDNDFSIWKRYANHFWPAIYLIDKTGMIRYLKIGEGGYDATERMIEALLRE